MSARSFLFWFRTGWLLALAALLPVRVDAHGAFDHNARVWVFEDHLEATVTLGPEAAKTFLNNGPAEVLRSGQMQIAYPFPLPDAARLLELKSGYTPLAPLKANVRSDGLEFNFTLYYAAPNSGPLRVSAVYMMEIQQVGKGSLVVVDEAGNTLGAKLISSTDTALEVNLPGNTAPVAATADALEVKITNAPPTTIAQTSTLRATPAFGEFLHLGVGHILTGFDHLLFLGALLIGVRRIGPMLAVITCFTLAHSVTLALAATNLVVISARITEPLIAASIIVVGIENFLRCDAVKDRYWLAGGFGLIHGFGFASALRETGLGGNGAAIVMPLFSFNLGVEIGQLAVAAVVVPLLFALRRWPMFARFGTPALSSMVIALSSYWLLERTFFYR